ncbi:MAG: QacE family quaternary ammonium compound efflux SMR transporter [Sphingomonas taxi]|uniref:QacE family quaternary ammonium compound efflux SMR transporter n=1 Tax=Sphingomonas taxi TaxID=1549858 RepID=A0A2W4YM82_9SPHN|nr:MAG: QacE family quaternary ammonium compound efflux SMR transporter [Sphingomonas taxi]
MNRGRRRSGHAVAAEQGSRQRWLLLAVAVVAEVAGALALKAALNQPLWIVLTIAGFATSFTVLARLLRTGSSLGVIYAIWAASGVALTAVSGAVLFGDVLSATTAAGIAIVIAGVVLVETGHGTPRATPRVDA